ncbi:hypothetical protein WMF04_18825 [Sorangium sp. So ce260]|uniref:hypothetical protein n=1 Tax=Sorangium sp. So ce260 TaxID=3133291 RepID=UPI003F60BBCC
MLQVEQPYDVVAGGTMLEAANIPAYVKGHPLVDTKVMANVNGAALAQIRTEFVNITPFWMAYAAFASEYVAEHQPGDPELVALGYTGGKPLIWFATVPAACAAPPAPGVGCLVFFRPTNYAYTRIDDAHHEMFGLNRYLLKPVDEPFADVWRRDVFRPDPDAGNNPFVYLRAGFEDALSRSHKSVVILHPWPSGSDFGAAISASLPALAGGALRLLWAEQRLGRNRGAIQLGRLGIAGYSSGGLSLWAALTSNKQRVSEVYAFDARGTSSNGGTAIQWFNSRSDTVLRMTGGYRQQPALGSRDRCLPTLAREGGLLASIRGLWRLRRHARSLRPDLSATVLAGLPVLKRALVPRVVAALAAALAAGQPGCHRERLPQGDASTGGLPSSVSALAAPASPSGAVSASGEGLNDLDAPRPGATGAPRSGSPQSIADAGSVSPAPGTAAGPSASPGKPFDQDAWLAARGVTWRPDASCWSTLATSPPQRLNECSCHKTLSLAEIELMVCSRAREQESTAVPFVTHTVLYTARGGALRAVLDVPTGAMLDDCAPGTPIPCSVALDLRVEGDAVRFEELAGTTPACDRPSIAANKPLPGTSGWNSASWQGARATYRRICNTRGRYVLQRGALRRAP